ncbi:MAG: GH25 family lysozyme [Anaerolineae bacterium]|jgi:GH25 family lysozyme M1 (1,4-beta-N-acetylmuramidase)|nr:GH25 family lysozyme [Anaerolineae bacterium]
MEKTAGIDVSRWQGEIDWTKVAAAGYRFAVIRATVGDQYTDPRFYVNWGRAKDAGLLLSAYHVLKPGTTPESQLAYFMGVVGERKADFPLVLDIEVADGLSSQKVTDSVRTSLQRLTELEGRKPIVYSARWFWSANVRPSAEWAAYDLWVANYGVSEPTLFDSWKTWRFWQYSEKGKVPGVQSTSTDLNWFAGSYDDLLAYSGQALQPEPEPQPQPQVGLRAKVTISKLNVRSGPGMNYPDIGDLHAGDVVTVLSLGGKDVWVEFEPGKWAALCYQGERYMKIE